MSKMKLSCHDRLDEMRFVTKTRKNNNMIDYIGLDYVKNDIELLGPI